MTKEEIKYQWISLPQWQRILIVSIAVVCVVYIFYFFFISPKREKIRLLKKDVEQLQQQVARLRETAKPEKLRELNQKILTIKKETNQIKQNIKQLEERIPSKPEFETIILTVSDIFRKSNMEIKDIGIKQEKTIYVYKEGSHLIFEEKKNKTRKPKRRTSKEKNQKKKEKLKLKEVPIYVETTGGVKSLRSALNHLADSKRFLSVDKISLQKDKKGILLTKVFIKTYYLPEKK